MRRNWKRTQPTSLHEAFRLCKDFAQEKKRLSMERIADLMGVTVDSLYKWLGTGRMPANLIPVYEHVCGIPMVTRWLASSAGKMMVDVPSGRLVRELDVLELQQVLNQAVAGIIDVASGKATKDDALASIRAGLCGLAWHENNLQKQDQPEFDFAEEL